MFNTPHFISILGYLGIGFISGAISHGFFSGTRSLIMAAIGICLFLLSQYLSEGEKNYFELFVFGLIYSIAVGMLSGGFQHFLDSPLRSLWIVPVGYFVSLLIYQLQHPESSSNKAKTLIVGFLTSIALYGAFYGAMHIIPESYFAGDHHGGASTENNGPSAGFFGDSETHHQDDEIKKNISTTGTIIEKNIPISGNDHDKNPNHN